jgi:hypothetical protein
LRLTLLVKKAQDPLHVGQLGVSVGEIFFAMEKTMLTQFSSVRHVPIKMQTQLGIFKHVLRMNPKTCINYPFVLAKQQKPIFSLPSCEC